MAYVVLFGWSGGKRREFADFDEALKFYAANGGHCLYDGDKADYAADWWDDGLSAGQRELVETSGQAVAS
jgi:hypothetical protein